MRLVMTPQEQLWKALLSLNYKRRKNTIQERLPLSMLGKCLVHFVSFSFPKSATELKK